MRLDELVIMAQGWGIVLEDWEEYQKGGEADVYDVISADDVDYLERLDAMLGKLPKKPATFFEVRNTFAEFFVDIPVRKEYRDICNAVGSLLKTAELSDQKIPWKALIQDLRDYLADEGAEPDEKVTLGEVFEALAAVIRTRQYELRGVDPAMPEYELYRYWGKWKVLIQLANVFVALAKMRGEDFGRGEDRPKEPNPDGAGDDLYSH